MLEDDMVLVRWVSTVGAESCLARCEEVLTREEQARAARFSREEPRINFVVGRWLARMTLAEVLGVPPVIEIGENGKPWARGVEFNLSHTEGMVGLAVSHDRAVGLDIERVDPAVEVLEVAAMAFLETDVTRLAALSKDERLIAFYKLWTEREAIAKCLGRGIADPAAMRGEWGGAGASLLALDLAMPFVGAVSFADALPVELRVERIDLVNRLEHGEVA